MEVWSVKVCVEVWRCGGVRGVEVWRCGGVEVWKCVSVGGGMEVWRWRGGGVEV